MVGIRGRLLIIGGTSAALLGASLAVPGGALAGTTRQAATAGRSMAAGQAALTSRQGLTVPQTLPVGPAVTISASTPDGPGRLQTLTFRQVLPRGGSVSGVVLTVPPGMLDGAALHAASGRVTRLVRPPVVTWHPATPVTVTAGHAITFTIGGFRLPAGTASVTLRAMHGARLLALGTGSLTVPAVTDVCPTSSWPTVTDENSLPGDPSWVIQKTEPGLSAWLSATSVGCGNTLTMRVDSAADQLVDVKAYRMGYYGGDGARLVWQSSAPVVAWKQPKALVLSPDKAKPDRMVTTRNWGPTLTIRIGSQFVPGTYLFKFTDRKGHACFAPLTVRDDTATRHDLLLQQATTTWAAYNNYGGYTFYSKPFSARLSFDRPYSKNFGASEYMAYEYGLVYWLEGQGYDVSYWTDQDLEDRAVTLATRTRTLVLPGHDEYYSVAMRRGVLTGLAHGVNLVVFGANTAYRVIVPSANRREFSVNTPWTAGGSSTTWRYRGYDYHEQAWLGSEYGCGGNASPVTSNRTWLWNGIPDGTTLTGLGNGEFDTTIGAAPRPAGVRVLTNVAPKACNRGLGMHLTMTAYTAPSGARVFNGASLAWSCFLLANCPTNWRNGKSPLTVSPETAGYVGTAVSNVLFWAQTGIQPVTSAGQLVTPSRQTKLWVELRSPGPRLPVVRMPHPKG